MTFIAIQSPRCHSAQVVKRGKTRRGTQRYLCQNTVCATGSFLLVYRNRGCVPEVKDTIIDMSLNAVGFAIRHECSGSARTPCSCAQEKRNSAESVNTAFYAPSTQTILR